MRCKSAWTTRYITKLPRTIVTVSETETKRECFKTCMNHTDSFMLVDNTGSQADRMAKLRNQQEVRSLIYCGS